MIAGRELLGYPKKLGDFTWNQTGDQITGIASRRGHTLISMTGSLGQVL